jgi:hypothetical protein
MARNRGNATSATPKPDGAGDKTGNASPAAGSGNDPVIDPGSVGGENGGNPSPGGDNSSGRKRRSDIGKTRTRQTRAPVDVDKFGDLIKLGHFIASRITSVPEFELEKDEADALAKASQDVMNLYGIRGPSEEIAAWLALAAVVGKTYTPRFGAWKLRKLSERAPTKTETVDAVAEKTIEPVPGVPGVVTMN